MKTRKLGPDPGMERSTSEESEVGKSELRGTASVSIDEMLILSENESATLSCELH